MIRTRAAVVMASMATVASLAACSSSGSSGVSQSQLEAKLNKDPAIAKILKAGGKQAAAAKKIVSCEARVLIKDANSSQLKDYVDGKITQKQVKPKSSAAKADGKSAVAACTKDAIKSAGG